jgi:hypothetical protein
MWRIPLPPRLQGSIENRATSPISCFPLRLTKPKRPKPPIWIRLPPRRRSHDSTAPPLSHERGCPRLGNRRPTRTNSTSMTIPRIGISTKAISEPWVPIRQPTHLLAGRVPRLPCSRRKTRDRPSVRVSPPREWLPHRPSDG